MNIKGKDVKKTETPSKEPTYEGFNRDEFFNNMLSLPAVLKEKLKAEGKVWRFINGHEFRTNGNVHRSHWRPQKFEESEFKDLVNAEGFIQRKEMILATRPKMVADEHKRHINDRNDRLKGYQKAQAAEFRKDIRKAQAEDTIRVSEGYGEED